MTRSVLHRQYNSNNRLDVVTTLCARAGVVHDMHTLSLHLRENKGRALFPWREARNFRNFHQQKQNLELLLTRRNRHVLQATAAPRSRREGSPDTSGERIARKL